MGKKKYRASKAALETFDRIWEPLVCNKNGVLIKALVIEQLHQIREERLQLVEILEARNQDLKEAYQKLRELEASLPPPPEEVHWEDVIFQSFENYPEDEFTTWWEEDPPASQLGPVPEEEMPLDVSDAFCVSMESDPVFAIKSVRAILADGRKFNFGFNTWTHEISTDFPFFKDDEIPEDWKPVLQYACKQLLKEER